MNNYVKIDVSDLPGRFPVNDYSETIYVAQRVKKLDPYIIKFMTQDKFGSVLDENYEERQIQNVVYDKYELTIYSNETPDIGIIEAANTVRITAMNGDYHHVKVLELTPGKQGDFDAYAYKLTYYDVNPANYNDFTLPVSNFLRSDWLESEIPEITLVRLQLHFPFLNINGVPTGPIIRNYYSALKVKENINPIEEGVDTIKNIIHPTTYNPQKTIELRLYLNEAKKNELIELCPRCFGVGLSGAANIMTIRQIFSNWTGVQRVIPEASEVQGSYNLYEVKINMVHENQFFNNFNN